MQHRTEASPGLFRQYALERVLHGQPFQDALSSELDRHADCRVFVMSAPGFDDTPAYRALQRSLGDRLVGGFFGVPAHSPLPAVMQAADRVRASGANHLVAIGGGSVIDAAKAVAFWVSEAVPAGFDPRKLPAIDSVDPSRRGDSDAQWLRITAIPVTLSAAEFTFFAGVTDPLTREKRIFGHAMMAPRAVIYDAALTAAVSLPTFLASGIKALDHAVERLASLRPHPMSDAMGKQAIEMLNGFLPRVKDAPDDLDARQQCQLAAWISISGGNAGVRVGASHALGHALGAHSLIPHGLTSCVLLPSVMRWNLPANAARQRIISQAFGCPDTPAADAIEALIASLGLPTRLRDAGVQKPELQAIADKALHDPVARHNPRPVRTSADLLEILHLAW
ncbi:iron-containing alcohol dehydrogenase [Achromobacter spanius]|uniref:iron-containing alcohol dehydrogenase n=1 Tax=Achromobacter spanius TaxID=217203 RepID=UPI0032084E80